MCALGLRVSRLRYLAHRLVDFGNLAGQVGASLILLCEVVVGSGDGIFEVRGILFRFSASRVRLIALYPGGFLAQSCRGEDFVILAKLLFDVALSIHGNSTAKPLPEGFTRRYEFGICRLVALNGLCNVVLFCNRSSSGGGRCRSCPIHGLPGFGFRVPRLFEFLFQSGQGGRRERRRMLGDRMLAYRAQLADAQVPPQQRGGIPMTGVGEFLIDCKGQPGCLLPLPLGRFGRRLCALAGLLPGPQAPFRRVRCSSRRCGANFRCG
ncbi:MAG: hypothetical protein JO001_25925 [Alphaproteobacteria bacterium]|nr:hypothetical protein [Alphaproteobacteria bacterium]